jgi:hypothetical protein
MESRIPGTPGPRIPGINCDADDYYDDKDHAEAKEVKRIVPTPVGEDWYEYHRSHPMGYDVDSVIGYCDRVLSSGFHHPDVILTASAVSQRELVQLRADVEKAKELGAEIVIGDDRGPWTCMYSTDRWL